MPTLRNLTAGTDLSTNVVRARSPLTRMIGWLCVAKLAPQQGLWLQPCSAIHTLGMRTSIDVILLDRQANVVALHARVRPNRWWLSHRGTAAMIEMGPGFLDAAAIAVGDVLALVDNGSPANA
ncbi:MAG: DUF192 domain-containing protein [Candidatus Velthaea sp.]|jgi:uncharacterized membrane protein (UPF0127 family)